MATPNDSLITCYRGLIAQGHTTDEAEQHCAVRFNVPRSVVFALVKIFERPTDEVIVSEPVGHAIAVEHTAACDDYRFLIHSTTGDDAPCVCNL